MIDVNFDGGNFKEIAVVVFVQNDSDKILIQSEIAVISFATRIGNTTSDDNSLQIFHNPAKNMANIQSSDEVNKIQLISLTGQVVLCQACLGNKTKLITTRFEPGIYFVKIFSADNVITKKIVIE